MKNLRALIVACLVMFSVFAVAGSAMAASVWTVSDLTNYDIVSFLIEDEEGDVNMFTGSQAFVMNVPETKIYANVLSSNKGEKVSRNLYYNTADYSFYTKKSTDSTGSVTYSNLFLNLSSSKGQFSFYFFDGNNYNELTYSLEANNSVYDFRAVDQSQMKQVVEVHDIAPVPIPSAVILFGTGLAGLVGLKRRKTQA